MPAPVATERPNRQAVHRQMVEWVRGQIDPTAANFVLSFEVADGGERKVCQLVIPSEYAEPDGIAGDIMAVLSALPSSMWLKRKALAAQIDDLLDPTAGNFTRALRRLVDAGRIEQDGKGGYRVVRSVPDDGAPRHGTDDDDGNDR